MVSSTECGAYLVLMLPSNFCVNSSSFDTISKRLPLRRFIERNNLAKSSSNIRRLKSGLSRSLFTKSRSINPKCTSWKWCWCKGSALNIFMLNLFTFFTQSTRKTGDVVVDIEVNWIELRHNLVCKEQM